MESRDGMSDAVLRLTDVRLSRGLRRVLAGVSFHVQRGELVALMGPSGVGKTTVLRVVAGLEAFESGTVQVEDMAISGGANIAAARLHAFRRKVGMVFQFHHLFEHLPAIKNVWLAPVHTRGVPRGLAEVRARELLAALGVENRAGALPRELSGGEAQRVAIARALAVDPPLLLMDEPTAAHDPDRRYELRDLLEGLLRGGRTLVLATHDEEFARACATRVLRVREGLVFEDG